MTRLLFKSAGILFLAPMLFSILLNTHSLSVAEASTGSITYVPDSLTFLSSDYAIVIDKTMQELFVFHSDEGHIALVHQAKCSTGKNSGKKTKTGDAKTPEGIYFPTRQYGDDELSSTYGSMAFHLDYPNPDDVRTGRNGNNIWLHGTDKPLQDFQSNGCITLENRDIEILSTYITLHKTPVIIYDYIKWVPQKVLLTLRKELRNMLDQWVDATKRGDKAAMESLYSPSVNKDNAVFLAEQAEKWRERNMVFSLELKNISLLKHDACAVISFEQILSLDDVTGSYGDRKLFLKKNPGDWLIIADMLQHPQTDEQFSRSILALDDSIITQVKSAGSQSIEELIRGWSESWESGDMDKYRSFYAPDFVSANKNLENWIKYKTRLSRVNKNIKIEIKNIKITMGSPKSVAVFDQSYSSSRYNSRGIKSLQLKKVNNRWLIHRELWKGDGG